MVTGQPFVNRVHVEPEECRRDLERPPWDAVADLLAALGVGPERRLDLYSDDALSVMTVEGDGDAFHISIQVAEASYYCLRGSAASSPGETEPLGPFEFESAEICRDRTIMTEVVHEFWARGRRLGDWNTYDASNELSPLNNTMAKASAEVGAMIQAYQAGNRGGPAKIRVRGTWKASPATRADMKIMGRMLELSKLTVTDSDGIVNTFEGSELLPVANGGKRWFA